MTKGRIAQLLCSLALLLLLTSTASAATFRLAGTRAPANMSAPAVAGTAKIGNTLTGSAGYWTGAKPMKYAYRWQSCDSTGAGCAAISGATASSYKVASTDAGRRLRLKVTASNKAGSASAFSAMTAAVPSPTSAPPPPPPLRPRRRLRLRRHPQPGCMSPGTSCSTRTATSSACTA